MKVKLQKSIHGVGSAGDVKEVKEGYAVNYLFPRNLAHPVAQDTALFTRQQKKVLKKKNKKATIVGADAFAGKVYTIQVATDAEGVLHTAVDKHMVEKVLQKQDAVTIKKMKPAHIKSLGNHTVTVYIQNTSCDIQLHIQSSK